MCSVPEYLLFREYGGPSVRKRRRRVEASFESRAAQPNKNEACKLSGHTRATFLLDFSPDGSKVASAHGDHSVRITDLATGKCLHVLTGHPRTPWCVAFHPASNEILASGCLGGEVRIWDLQGGGSESWHSPSNTVIASLCFHPTDHVLVFVLGNGLYFWDWSRPEPFAICKTSVEAERVRWVRFDPLGHYLYTGITNDMASEATEPPTISHISDSNIDPALGLRQQALRQRYQDLLSRFQTYQHERTHIRPEPSLQRGADEEPIVDVEIVEPRSPTVDDALQSAQEYAAEVTRETTRRIRSAQQYAASITYAMRRRNTVPHSMNETSTSGSSITRSESHDDMSSQLNRDEPGPTRHPRLRRLAFSITGARPGTWSPPPRQAESVDSDWYDSQDNSSRENSDDSNFRSTSTTSRAPTSSQSLLLSSLRISNASSSDFNGSAFSPIVSRQRSQYPLPAETSTTPYHNNPIFSTTQTSATTSWSSQPPLEQSQDVTRARSILRLPLTRADTATVNSQNSSLLAIGSDSSPTSSLPVYPRSSHRRSLRQRLVYSPRSLRASLTAMRERHQRLRSPISAFDETSVRAPYYSMPMGLQSETRGMNDNSHEFLSREASEDADRIRESSLLDSESGHFEISRSRIPDNGSDNNRQSISPALLLNRRDSSPTLDDGVLRRPYSLSLSAARQALRHHEVASRSRTLNAVALGSASHLPLERSASFHDNLDDVHSIDSIENDWSIIVSQAESNIGQERERPLLSPIAGLGSDVQSGSGGEMVIDDSTLESSDAFTTLAASATTTASSLSISGTVASSAGSSATAIPEQDDEHADIRAMTSRLAQEINELDRRMSVLRERFTERMRAFYESQSRLSRVESDLRDISSGVPTSTVPSTSVSSSSSSSSSSASSSSSSSSSSSLLSAGPPSALSPNQVPQIRITHVTPDEVSISRQQIRAHNENESAFTIHRRAQPSAPPMPVGLMDMPMDDDEEEDEEPPAPTSMMDLDPHWHTFPRHHLHPHYATSILDETVNRPNVALQAAINRAIAGAFVGTGEAAVASNIINLTHRIQRWDFVNFSMPDLSNAHSNVIVAQCKLHYDASCDISHDGTLLATFIPSHRGFPDDMILGVFSLQRSTLGQCLYTKSFGPNALSVSISPLNTHIVVGLASRRLVWVFRSSQMVAQVYKLAQPKGGENSMKHVTDILHTCQSESRSHISVNSVRWLPRVGEGLIYGTIKGDLHICRPFPDKITEKHSIHTATEDEVSQSDEPVSSETISIRRNLMSMLGLSVPRTITTATQTVHRQNWPSAGTQTEGNNSSSNDRGSNQE